jgi:serine/threonine protein kinase
VADVHDKRILHLDIKPENFLFVDGVLKIIDFGLAKKLPKKRNAIGNHIKINILYVLNPNTHGKMLH